MEASLSLPGYSSFFSGVAGLAAAAVFGSNPLLSSKYLIGTSTVWIVLIVECHLPVATRYPDPPAKISSKNKMIGLRIISMMLS